MEKEMVGVLFIVVMEMFKVGIGKTGNYVDMPE
jgi:hypothetical protein